MVSGYRAGRHRASLSQTSIFFNILEHHGFPSSENSQLFPLPFLPWHFPCHCFPSSLPTLYSVQTRKSNFLSIDHNTEEIIHHCTFLPSLYTVPRLVPCSSPSFLPGTLSRQQDREGNPKQSTELGRQSSEPEQLTQLDFLVGVLEVRELGR